MIYKYSLDRIPKQEAQQLFKHYTMFEKKFGDRRGIEDVIVSKRRFQYEEEVKVRRQQLSACGLRRESSLTARLPVCPGEPTQLRRLVRLPSPGGERRRPRHGERCLRARHRQHPSHSGEETLETIHLPVDQLRSVRRAGSQGPASAVLHQSSANSTSALVSNSSLCNI